MSRPRVQISVSALDNTNIDALAAGSRARGGAVGAAVARTTSAIRSSLIVVNSLVGSSAGTVQVAATTNAR